MSNQELDQEENIEELNFVIKMGEALKALENNKDFKTVIREGFLKEKVLASVSLLAVPAIKNDRSSVMEDIIAASNLQLFLQTIASNYEAEMNPVEDDIDMEEV